MDSILPVLLLLVILLPASESSTLKMVHLVYRHGARSPTNFYPNDIYNDRWPDGEGRLTQKGKSFNSMLLSLLKKKVHFDDGASYATDFLIQCIAYA